MTSSSAFLRRLVKPAVLAAVLFFIWGIAICGVAIWAQSTDESTPQLPGVSRHRGVSQPSDEDAATAQQTRDMAKKQNLKRQQDLKKDTDKLLELATQLKQYVDKTNENTLSVEVIKKAEQIEKLAHSVKEKMKGQ
jgi:hypothetical protein